MKRRIYTIFLFLMLQVLPCLYSFLNAQCNLLCNTDFEDNQVTAPATFNVVDASQVNCWQTTASDNMIEFWNTGYLGVPSYSGNQFIELNANVVSTIFQNFTVAPGTILNISFAHRGTNGTDVASVEVGPVGGPYTTLGSYSTGNTAWAYYSVSYTVPLNLGSNYSLRFNSISSAGGNPLSGNFLDAISVFITSPNVSVNSGLNALCDSTKLNWAKWTSVDATSGIGQISSSLFVTVTKPSAGLSTTSGIFNPGMFPTQYTVPVNSTAIRNDIAGLFTFCFNVPVVNPQIALSSIGGNITVQVNTSAPYQVIWSGPGMSYPNPNTLIGTEGYCIIKFPGTHTCISFDYLQDETYCNLAFGVLDTNCQALSPPLLCNGMSDTLYATGALTYSWSPSQGLNTTSGATVIASPTVTTTYYVTGTDGNGCTDTDSITINVNPSPPIAIVADTSICVGDSTLLTASGADSYLWKPSNTTNSSLMVQPSANTTYKVIGTTNFGCSDSTYVNVTVNSLPTVVITPQAPSICDVFSQELIANGANTYSWSPQTGLNSTSNDTVVASPVTSITYTVSGTNTQGCVDTASFAINIVSSQLNVNVNSGLNPLCDSTKLNWATWTNVDATSGIGQISSNLSVTVTKPTGGLSTTGGMFNGGVFPTQHSVPINSTAIRNDLAGLFTFCFNVPVVDPQIALSSIGNGGNPVQINTSVPYQVIWQGLSMTYPNSSTFIGAEGYTIIKFPGVHTCISFDYLNSESYCNLAFGTLDTNCQALTPAVLCAGMSDTLYATGATTYSWNPAQGLNTTSGATVIASPTVTTTYYVTGTDGNGCSDTDSITINVNPLPPILLTADTSICIGDSTLLTASGADSYLWKPSNTVNPLLIVSPSADATYKVIGTNSFGCSDSVSVNVIVNPLPTLQLSANEVCYNDSTNFTVSSTGNIVLWNWDYGDANFSTQQNASHLYATCDSFSVVLVATTLEGCVDSTTTVAHVNCLPTASFQFANDCVNDSILFTDASSVFNDSIVQWNWNFDDNTSGASLQNVTHAFSQVGQYDISLISTTSKGCKDTLQQVLTVYPKPVVQFSFENICAGSFATFQNFSEIQAPSVVSSWQWTFGDNTVPFNSTNASHLYSQAGNYIVNLTAVSDFGCADSTSQILVVNPNPIVAFSAIDTAGCFPLCVSFIDETNIQSPATISNWMWHFDDNDSSSSANPQHCFTNTSATNLQAYTIELTAISDSGCVTSLTKNNYIQVYPKPQATFIAEPLVTSVINPIITFTNQSIGADSYVWNFGETLDSLYTLLVSPYQYGDTGTYITTLIIQNQYACSDTSIQNIIIEPEFTFYVPSAFSPNDDGINDSFIGQGRFITEYAMSIYDRWGVLIYYTDDITKPWNGKINGGTVLAKQDTYVYSIDLKDFKKRKYRYRGTVTLVGGDSN